MQVRLLGQLLRRNAENYLQNYKDETVNDTFRR